MNEKKIVCVGGGIGTVNLLKGLKEFTSNITVIVSVADDGGSAGRLRRLYQMHPPGDIVSCLAVLSQNEKQAKLLTYRLPGDRYAEDQNLAGHKVGNIMLAAATQISGSFEEGVELLRDLFKVRGQIFAATKDMVSISARTIEGKMVQGEEVIDLGKYPGKRILEHVFINPENPAVDKQVLEAISAADIIITGPGDLYTNNLPVLIVPAIKEALIQTKAQKIFIVNVANKPFETKGYAVEDFVQAITKHLGIFPFDTIITNTNFSISIPDKFHYTYVKPHQSMNNNHTYKIVSDNVVDEKFPLYHDSRKLAKLIWKTI